MIREAARGFLQDWYASGKGPERIYQNGTGNDPKAWKTFAQEMGMTGIAIDEIYGGAGLGDLGRVVIMEELGASLCSIPFLTTCGIAADIISAFATQDIKTELLTQIAAGELTAVYCDGHDAKGAKVSNVVNAASVDIILLSRYAADGIELIAINSDAAGLDIQSKTTMDPTRNFANLTWKNVEKQNIKVVGRTTKPDLEKIVRQSFIGLAAECVGGAQQCLDMTLEYASQRVQFDRPIASFQAIKHRCADMFILIQAARSAVYAAALAHEEDKTEAALIAKAYASDAFFKVAGDAIQLHGGIGFTWEYPLHFFFKRARANRIMFGNSSRDYDRLADEIFGDAA